MCLVSLREFETDAQCPVHFLTLLIEGVLQGGPLPIDLFWRFASLQRRLSSVANRIGIVAEPQVALGLPIGNVFGKPTEDLQSFVVVTAPEVNSPVEDFSEL